MMVGWSQRYGGGNGILDGGIVVVVKIVVEIMAASGGCDRRG